MMKELIWAEHQKLRRSKIVLVAIFAVIMVAIIVFTQGQFSFGEKRYIDDAGWFMNTPRSTIQYRRTSSFEQLRKYLEENADEWDEW